MKAIRCVDGQAVLVDVPRPDGDGVVVKVSSASICGSDLHLVSMLPPTLTIGHEFAGIAPDGTAVAVEPILGCGSCHRCIGGRYNICEGDPGTAILGISSDGGMAEEVLVSADQLVRLPEGLDPAVACLVEPMAVAVHGVRLAAIDSATRVLVVGAGPIGLSAAAAVRARGAEVDIAARHDAQREAAARIGAGEQSDAPYDVVVDAAGSESAAADAVRACRSGGSLVLVSTPWGRDLTFPGMETCLKELSILPSSMYGRGPDGRDVDLAAEILASDPAVAEALITARLPLDAVAEGFALAADRAGGTIKVAFDISA